MKVRFFISQLIALMLLSLLTSSCSKKGHHPEIKYTPEEFNLMMDSMGATIDKDVSRAINFAEYSPGVNRINSRALLFQRLSFSAIEFETETQAKNEAMRLSQYYSRNWLFDKVDGEPILEDAIILKFNAINPSKRVQRKVIHAPEVKHHVDH